MCPTFVGQVAGSFVACNQEWRAFGKPSDRTALGGWPVEPSASGGTEGSLGDDFDARQSRTGATTTRRSPCHRLHLLQASSAAAVCAQRP